jgi:Domain of unknown function (DUF4136)
MKHGLLTAALVLLASCAAPRPRADIDPAANFSGLHSFAWLAEDPLFQPGDGDKPVSLLNRRLVVESIEATLLARGFVKAEKREAADFTLVYSVGTRERISGTAWSDGPYRPWFWGWPYSGQDMALSMSSEVEGRLAIDVLDGASKKPIWHGVSGEVLGANDLDHPGPRLTRAAQAVLLQFPPR